MRWCIASFLEDPQKDKNVSKYLPAFLNFNSIQRYDKQKNGFRALWGLKMFPAHKGHIFCLNVDVVKSKKNISKMLLTLFHCVQRGYVKSEFIHVL